MLGKGSAAPRQLRDPDSRGSGERRSCYITSGAVEIQKRGFWLRMATELTRPHRHTESTAARGTPPSGKPNWQGGPPHRATRSGQERLKRSHHHPAWAWGPTTGRALPARSSSLRGEGSAPHGSRKGHSHRASHCRPSAGRGCSSPHRAAAHAPCSLPGQRPAQPAALGADAHPATGRGAGTVTARSERQWASVAVYLLCPRPGRVHLRCPGPVHVDAESGGSELAKFSESCLSLFWPSLNCGGGNIS